MPSTGLRGEDGWNRGDRVNAAVADESVLSVEIDTDELFVNIDDVDDDDKFVNGASAFPLPIKPLRLIGVAKLKPFRCNSRGCGILRGFGESNDKSEPALHLSISLNWFFVFLVSFRLSDVLSVVQIYIMMGKLTSQIERREQCLEIITRFYINNWNNAMKFRSNQLKYTRYIFNYMHYI